MALPNTAASSHLTHPDILELHTLLAQSIKVLLQAATHSSAHCCEAGCRERCVWGGQAAWRRQPAWASNPAPVLRLLPECKTQPVVMLPHPLTQNLLPMLQTRCEFLCTVLQAGLQPWPIRHSVCQTFCVSGTARHPAERFCIWMLRGLQMKTCR